MKKNIKKMMKRMVILSFLTTVVAPPLYGFAEEKTTERTIEESNYTLVVENYNDDFSVELKRIAALIWKKIGTGLIKLLIRFLHLLGDRRDIMLDWAILCITVILKHRH